MVLYALHDAMVKPMPGQALAPSLAESWTASEDGLSYEFTLRKDILFHNGEQITAEDVKFPYERYRGASHDMMKARVAAIDVIDPKHLRFRLKEPWPDFLTFYGSATGAGWIVPKKYVEKVGEDGFKKAPIGAGPYKFVSFNPGIELVLEAFDAYGRKPASVLRVVIKAIPDESTRLAALKTGEVDIAYWISGELAADLQHTPGLTLKAAVVQTPWWVYFPEQWDSKSPWHDARLRSRRPRDQSRRHQPGDDVRLLQADRQCVCPGEFRLLLAAARAGLRPRESQAAGGRGGPSERPGRRCVLLRRRLREHRRGRGEQSA
jgi:peptide/nickel transport system substrate-binding protein